MFRINAHFYRGECELRSGYKDEALIDFEYVANKLGIAVDKLQEYMDKPNKTYKDYRSQGKIYAVGAKVMKLLGLELGGKR